MFLTRPRNHTSRYTFGNPLELINRVIGDASHAANFPAFNVWSDEEGAVVTSEIPGVAMSDLEITASGKTISIKGARKEPENEGEARYIRRERPLGEFNRAVELPFQIDSSKVEAKLTNGVLRIVLPRAESDKPRKIQVNAG